MAAKSLLRRPGVYVLILCAACAVAWAEGQNKSAPDKTPTASTQQNSQSPIDDDKLLEDIINKVEQAIIHPYQSANVGAEVGGVIKGVNFQEGDRVESGEVVVEIFEERETAFTQKAEEKLKGLELELQRAEADVRIKEDLVSLGGGTRQELEKAQAEVDIIRQKIKETREDLKLARFNLRACRIKAPFSGYVAVRYKQPYETVERLEKVFAILDSSSVHAVANVPEILLQKFQKDTDAVFIHSSGKKFKGKVDRVGKLIDPKSMTKRVYVLIDNPKGELEIGSSGTLELAD